MTLLAGPSLAVGVATALACSRRKNVGSDNPKPPIAPTVKKLRRLSGFPGQHCMDQSSVESAERCLLRGPPRIDGLRRATQLRTINSIKSRILSSSQVLMV